MSYGDSRSVESWLRNHKRTKCQCGSARYSVGEPSALLPLRSGRPDLDGRSPKRVVPVTCNDCGEVRFFSVEVLGVAT